MSRCGALRTALLGAVVLLAACRADGAGRAGAEGGRARQAPPETGSRAPADHSPRGSGPSAPSDQAADRPSPEAMARAGTALVLLPGGGRRVVEVAADPEARRVGLMFRDSLPPDGGMLLAFERPGPHAIWMKNCRFPLDLLWLDSSGSILALVESAPPCTADPCPSYAPSAAASYVLELEGGAARREGLRVGGRLGIVSLAPPP